MSIDTSRALCPYTAWPHRVDVDKDIPIYEHGYCAEQPLLDLASGTFPTGLFQDPEIDLPKQNFNPRSESDIKENARCKPSCVLRKVS